MYKLLLLLRLTYPHFWLVAPTLLDRHKAVDFKFLNLLSLLRELETFLQLQQILLQAHNLSQFQGKFSSPIKKCLISDRFVTNWWANQALSLVHHCLKFRIATLLSLLDLISVIGNARCNVLSLMYIVLLNYFKESLICNYLRIELKQWLFHLKLEGLLMSLC